jgi:membrane protease YdiL (CAAX protease family)
MLLAGPGNLPIDTEQSKEILPLLYISMLVGPGAAGILLTIIVNGKAGLLKLKSQLFDWRRGIRWYLTALFATPILVSVTLIFLTYFSPEFNLGIYSSDDKSSFLISGIVIGLMVGLFEEIGWSGFVVPAIRLRYNIFITGLIVGVVWGAWHFILFWETNSFSKTLPFLILLGRLFAWLPPFRILLVWILERTESLLLVILTHASLVFSTTVLVPMTLTGNNLLTWLIFWGLVLWVIVIMIAVFNGRILFRKPKKQKQTKI